MLCPSISHFLLVCLAGGKEVVITRKTGEAVLRGAPVYAPGKLVLEAVSVVSALYLMSL